MQAIWQAAVEAPMVLLLMACTGTGHVPRGSCRGRACRRPPAWLVADPGPRRRYLPLPQLRGAADLSADWPPPDEQIGERSNGRGYGA